MKVDAAVTMSSTELFLVGCSLFPQENNSWLTDDLIDRLDWRKVEKRAVWHKLYESFSLATTRLHLLDQLPIETRSRVIKHLTSATLRDQVISLELARITEAFATEGIPLLFLKGIALIPLIYGSLIARGFHDLDILVPPGSVERAFQILTSELGYLCRVSAATKLAYISTSYQYPRLIHPRGFIVELHFRCWHEHLPFLDDTEGMFKTAQEALYNNTTTICIPSIEQVLLHLCIHLYCHHAYANDYHLRHHADIRNLICKYHEHIDWNGFLNRTCDLRAQLGISYALHYTEGIYGSLLPHGFLGTIMTKEIYKELEAIRNNSLGNHAGVGFWDVPYLGRLFAYIDKASLVAQLDQAVANLQYDQYTRDVADHLGIDVRELQDND